MGNAGISFSGNGAQDVSQSPNGTEPGNAPAGDKSGGVEFAGNGAQDVRTGNTDTTQHDKSEYTPKGAGSTDVEFAAESVRKSVK